VERKRRCFVADHLHRVGDQSDDLNTQTLQRLVVQRQNRQVGVDRRVRLLSPVRTPESGTDCPRTNGEPSNAATSETVALALLRLSFDGFVGPDPGFAQGPGWGYAFHHVVVRCSMARAACHVWTVRAGLRLSKREPKPSWCTGDLTSSCDRAQPVARHTSPRYQAPAEAGPHHLRVEVTDRGRYGR